jgi:stress response protein SCP2
LFPDGTWSPRIGHYGFQHFLPTKKTTKNAPAATTSDPYVQVQYQQVQYGKTRTISKNCINPQWDETIQIQFNANEAREVIEQCCYRDGGIDTTSRINRTTIPEEADIDTTTTITTTATTAAATLSSSSQQQQQQQQLETLLSFPTIDLWIYDADTYSSDDCMGIVQIPITVDFIRNCNNNTSTTSTIQQQEQKWYTVANYQLQLAAAATSTTTSEVRRQEACRNATGELYVAIRIEYQFMSNLHKSPNRTVLLPTTQQDVSLSSSSSSTTTFPSSYLGRYDMEVSWTYRIHDQNGVRIPIVKQNEFRIDTCCIAIDQTSQRKVNLEHSVYYNNLQNENRSIQQHGFIHGVVPDTTVRNRDGQQISKNELYFLQLLSIPSHITALYVGVFVVNPTDQYFSECVSSITLRILHMNTKMGVCAMTLPFDTTEVIQQQQQQLPKHTALLMARITRCPSLNDKDHDIWTIQPVEKIIQANSFIVETNDKGRDFGTIIPEIKACVHRDRIIPNMILNPNEPRIAIIRNGGTICVRDYVHQEQVSPEQGLRFECSWKQMTLPQIHPITTYKVSAVLLDFNYQLAEMNVETSAKSDDWCIRHSQTERDTLRDKNCMNLSLPNIPGYIKYIAFVISTEKPLNFDLYHMMSCRIFNPITNQDIVLYHQPKHSKIQLGKTYLLMSCLYRKADLPFTSESVDTTSTSSSSSNNNNDSCDWYFHIFDDPLPMPFTEHINECTRKRIEECHAQLHKGNPTGTAHDANSPMTEHEIVL